MTRLVPSTLWIASLAMAACGGGGGGSGNPGQTTDTGIYVDGTGDDVTGDGSSAHPFRSITRGLGPLGFGETLHVGPGTYDAAHGEFFPIVPGIGSHIVGARRQLALGGSLQLTHVVGGGFWAGDVDHRLHATIVPSADDQISGMTFENPQPFVVGGAKPAAVILASPRVHLDGCSFLNSDKGMRLLGGANDTWTTQCAFTGNLGAGIFVEGASGANRFEDCYVANNQTGVFLFSTGADFGGDITASSGGNVFTGNDSNDFVNAAGQGTTIYAAYCYWDHAPPTYAGPGSPDPAADIWIVDLGSNVVSGSAQLYDPNNPPPAGP